MEKTKTKPIILDGKTYAKEILHHIKSEVDILKLQNKRLPGLAVILVGENPSSITYVTNKEKKCKETGIYSEVHRLPTNISEKELISIVDSLNKNTLIDGIITQLPLPIHLKAETIIEHILPSKDVDGLHPYNIGNLTSGYDGLKPCTPKGIIGILKYYSINLEGMSTVVIGRSNLVGKPVSMLLLNENATVTIAHSKTKNLPEITRNADLLVCAIGKPELIKKDWVKKNAIVIDVGINIIHESGKSKLVGDVDFDSVSSICKAITPVPGGIGAVTVAMLLANTLEAYKGRTGG